MDQPLQIHHGKQIDAIESLRGIAAVMILIVHLVSLAKLPLPEYLSFISSHFGLGVPLFYALSGFVLSYGYADRLTSREQILAFYTRRLFRIMPLFYSAMLVWILLNWFQFNLVYGLQAIILNLSFLFGLVPGKHDSIVPAGWSIGIEMLFYFIFPLVITLVNNARVSAVAFVIACFVAYATSSALREARLDSYAYMNLINHLPYFIAGITAYRSWQALNYKRHYAGWLILATAVLLVILSQLQILPHRLALVLPPQTHDFIWAANQFQWVVIFGMLILASVMIRNPLLELKPLRDLGRVSFSFYLLHPLVLHALTHGGIIEEISSIFPDKTLAFTLGTTIAMASVWALSRLTFKYIEYPGMQAGRLITRRL